MNFKSEIENLADSNSISRMQIHELYDLSFIEIVTLNHLIKLNEPILRFSLYKEMNSLLNPVKNLSTSSFYNSLRDLEQRGLVTFSNLSDDPKAHTVEATEKSRSVLGFFYYYLIQNSIVQEHGLENAFNHAVTELIGDTEINRLMIIESESSESSDLSTSIIPLAMHNLKVFARISKSVFLLSTDEFYTTFNASLDSKSSKIERSRKNSDDGKIREPDNYFDAIIIPLYQSLDIKSMIKELKRLLTANGVLILITFEEIHSDNDHYFVQVLVENLYASGYFTPYILNELKKVLIDFGFKSVKNQSIKGINLIAAYL